jgi:hypothetical protein
MLTIPYNSPRLFSIAIGNRHRLPYAQLQSDATTIPCRRDVPDYSKGQLYEITPP